MFVDYKKEGKIAIITLNRPDARNALNPEVMVELSKVFIDFKDDDNIWAGIVTGSGEKSFCAGADIKTALPQIKKIKDQPWAEPPTILRGLTVWKPIIAAVNGVALGGGLELALACDLRIAAENALFGVPEVTLGIIPGWGGATRLPRFIPRAKAAELLLTGRPIDAQEAYRIGLVNKVVPAAELMSAAMQMAEDLCRPAPLAVRAAKRLLIQGTNLPFSEAMELEKAMNDILGETEDFVEGTQAFAEKRKADFKAK